MDNISIMRRPKLRALICVCVSTILLLNYKLWRKLEQTKVGDNNNNNQISILTREQIRTNRLMFEPMKRDQASVKPFVAVVTCAVAKGVYPKDIDHMALTKFMLSSLLKVNTVYQEDFLRDFGGGVLSKLIYFVSHRQGFGF